MKHHTWRLVTIMLVLSLVAPAFASSQFSAVKGCRRAITNRGKAYANKRRQLMLSCVDRLLACDLKREIGDTGYSFSHGRCRSYALLTCKFKLGSQSTSGLSAAKAKFVNSAGAKCAAALGAGPFATSPIMASGSGGLWFSNDSTCGTSADLPTLLRCLEDEMNDRIDAVVSGVKPRAGLLLDNAGYGAAFPNLTRPPVVTQTITAAANGSPLDSIGAITLATGEALRFEATAAVGCGPGQGNNGHVTISVGPGLTCSTGTPIQQYTLKEPYGSSELAIVGPFNVDQGYCIERKDGGGCMDEISGTIDVPNGVAPATGSAATLACQTRFDTKVRSLAARVAGRTHRCTEKAVQCNLAQEIDGRTLAGCDHILASCNRASTAISRLLLAMKDPSSGIPKMCGPVSWDSLTAFTGGLGFMNVAADAGCTAGDLACLLDAVLGTPTGTSGTKCEVEHKVFIRDPRALDSLMSISPGFESNFPCVGP